MSATEQAETLLRMMFAATASPLITGRTEIYVGRAARLFDATPLRRSRGGVRLVFQQQMLSHPEPMMILAEAVAAAEAIIYGTSVARAIRLDAETRAWFEWEINQREQGSD